MGLGLILGMSGPTSRCSNATKASTSLVVGGKNAPRLFVRTELYHRLLHNVGVCTLSR
jgi:hypothetical protein